MRTIEQVFSGEIKFIAGVTKPNNIPSESLNEIAFVGKSNVGKSSLINAICGRRALARVSHTPGRTQQINFFNVSDLFQIVDLPGYGYASVPDAMRNSWEKLILSYLSQRTTLKLVCVLIDARRGIAENDLRILDLLISLKHYVWIIFTKSDKVRQHELLMNNAKELLDFRFRGSFCMFCISNRSIESVRKLKTNIWEFFSKEI